MSHPRTHPVTGAPGNAATEFFAADLGRPLLIVGNGPSAGVPRHDLIPDDPVVFRMNWFFLEDRYHYGTRVDGFFYSIPNAMLEHQLRQVIASKDYDVRALLSPMRVPAGRDAETHRSTIYESGVAELDHWSVIAGNPVFARFMMSRPLPTQGVQVLAFALELGFRDITLCGIDMYESNTARYGFTVPEEVAASLQLKDLTPGYESNHSLDRDLDFVDACMAQHPDARIRHIGPSRHLAARFDTPEPRDRGCTFGGVPARDLAIAPKRRLAVGDDGVASTDGLPLPYATIDGRRCGYVTLVGGNFHHGARALARSLAKVSDVPLLVMCTPNADRAALAASGLTCIDIPDVYNPNTLTARPARYAATYRKLNAFRMTHLDRAVYLDSDMIVLRSLDDLFEGDGFSAVPDHGLDHEYDRFNSGLFAFDPSAATFDRMMERIAGTHSYDDGDQGFLNEFFSEWHRLPHAYNVNKRWFAHHPNLFHLDTTRVVHYVGIKPWQPEPDTAYGELYRLWFEQLEPWELIEVVEQLRPLSRPGISEPVASPFTHIRQLIPRRRRTVRISDTRTLDGNVNSLYRAGDFDGIVAYLDEHWPGDDLASAGLWRRRGMSQILSGDLAGGVGTLEAATTRFPQDATISASLRKAQRLLDAHRRTYGLVPARAIAAVARRAVRG